MLSEEFQTMKLTMQAADSCPETVTYFKWQIFYMGMLSPESGLLLCS